MCHLTQNNNILPKSKVIPMPRTTKKRLSRIKKTVAVLNNHPGGIWLREISRQTGIHIEEIRRLIALYPMLFEDYADFTPYNINLKIIKLKNQNISPEKVERFLKTINLSDNLDK